MILVTFSAQVRPAGKTDDARAMVPVKPLRGATVMVEAPTVPEMAVMVDGLALKLKSGDGTLLLKVAV